jgi:hypothetical protein
VDAVAKRYGCANVTTGALLRRWDHDAGPRIPAHAQRAGALVVRSDSPVKLEHGLEIVFDKAGRYQTGDYWLIPARTGTIDWPIEETKDKCPPPARALKPRGEQHYYAPLAVVTFENGVFKDVKSMRRVLKQIWQ